MTEIAHASVTSPAPASAFFGRWADMASWPEWNADTEWVRLDTPFVTGGTGVLKPKGGPKVPFVIERLTPGTEFVDVSTLLGARLTFDHQVVTTSDGGCRVDVRISLSGPLSRVWLLILGKGLKASAQPDLDALARTIESSRSLPQDGDPGRSSSSGTQSV